LVEEIIKRDILGSDLELIMKEGTVVCSSLGTQMQKQKGKTSNFKNRPLHHRYSISLGVVCCKVYPSTFFAQFNVPSELKSIVAATYNLRDLIILLDQ
jgi:hypothetical protein